MRWIKHVLLLSAGGAIFALTPALRAQDENRRMSREEREEMSALEKERERLNRLSEWARRTNATPAQIFVHVYEPIVKGNQEDFKRNLALAARYRDRAQDAIDKRMNENARKYAAVSHTFQEYAQLNRQIVEALRERDSVKLDEAFEKVPEIEQQLYDLTGKTVERAWFTPRELASANRSVSAD